MTDGPPLLRDGRYEGSNADFLIEVRIDAHGCGVISGDLFLAGTPGHEHVASARTAPGTAVALADGAWPGTYQSYDGTTVPGRIAIDPLPGDGDAATVRFRADRALNAMPAAVDVVAVVRWTAPEFRKLGLEMETEQGVTLPESVPVDGVPTTVPDILRRAGFQVRDVGQPTMIPRNGGGWPWDESVVYGVLDGVMRLVAQDRLNLPAWKVHVLRLARPARPGLYGVMFDVAELLPRQGCAIFVDEIRARAPEEFRDRRILHTVAHEVGHAFNLAHRFEQGVGRADSTSVMNYPDEFPAGEAEYWRRCALEFDPDELAFLRHGPRSEVMPGTAPFHSADYWSAASGTRQAFIPESPTPGFDLRLIPPDNRGVFTFGQPVFVEVSLQNTGPEPIPMPSSVLDIKAGRLEVLIERTSAAGSTRVPAERFVPMVQRCVGRTIDATAGPTMLRPDDEPWRDNLNLSYGASGFAMAEPGSYRLTPLLTVEPGGPVVRGRSLPVRIAYPADRRDEEQAIRLLQPDVGAWFVLAGSNVLRKAHDEVRSVLDERTFERRRTDGGPAAGEVDPIAAAITRTLGIHAGRSYLRLGDRRFEPQPGDTGLATKMLGDLVADPGARSCFDRSTIAATKALVDKLRPGYGSGPR